MYWVKGRVSGGNTGGTASMLRQTGTDEGAEGPDGKPVREPLSSDQSSPSEPHSSVRPQPNPSSDLNSTPVMLMLIYCPLKRNT